MRTALKHFLSDIRRGENIDIYIIFILAAIVAVLGVIGTIPLAILSAGILATLGVLAYSTLATRRLLSELSRAIASQYSQASTPLKDRSAYGSFRDSLDGVSTIWLCGPSLVVMLATYKDYFRAKMRHGGEMRVLIFNPSSKNLPILAENLGVRPSKIEAEIKTTIENCSDLVRSGLGAGKFEVCQTEMIPGCSLVIFNPSEHDGRLSVEFVGYHTRTSERPHIELEATRDRQWFAFYLNQFDELWKSATPIVFDEPSS